MSIEMTLTLMVAALILVAGVAIRAAVYGLIKLFVIVREWVDPAPSHRRASGPGAGHRTVRLPGPAAK
jgi:hypothetical protein